MQERCNSIANALELHFSWYTACNKLMFQSFSKSDGEILHVTQNEKS